MIFHGKHLGHASGSQLPDAAMAIHYIGSKSEGWSRDVFCYCGLHIGCQFQSHVFSPIQEESSSTGPMGLKTLMHWMLKYVDIHLFTLGNQRGLR